MWHSLLRKVTIYWYDWATGKPLWPRCHKKKLQTISLPTLGFTYQTRFLSFNGVLSKRQFLLVSLSYKSHLCMWSLVNCTSVLGEQCFSPYTPLQLTIIVQCSPDDRLTNIIQAVSLGFFGVRTPFSLSATPGEGNTSGWVCILFQGGKHKQLLFWNP